MTLQAVKEELKDISWDEFYNWRLTEEVPDVDEVAQMNEIETRLRQLGARMSADMLDQLEEEGHFLKWVLRLSRFVKDDNSYDRAKRFMSHENRQVRYWAAWLMDSILPD